MTDSGLALSVALVKDVAHLVKGFAAARGDNFFHCLGIIGSQAVAVACDEIHAATREIGVEIRECGLDDHIAVVGIHNAHTSVNRDFCQNAAI